MEEEIVKVDISPCIGYIRYISKLPLEIVLIQKFKMSFQGGQSNVDFFNKVIGKNILNNENASLADILLNVNTTRYYKCIYSINSILEQAILKKLENPDIDGVEFKSIDNVDGKLIASFKVFR